MLYTLLKENPSYFEFLKKIPLNIEYSSLSQAGIP